MDRAQSRWGTGDWLARPAFRHKRLSCHLILNGQLDYLRGRRAGTGLGFGCEIHHGPEGSDNLDKSDSDSGQPLQHLSCEFQITMDRCVARISVEELLKCADFLDKLLLQLTERPRSCIDLTFGRSAQRDGSGRGIQQNIFGVDLKFWRLKTMLFVIHSKELTQCDVFERGVEQLVIS